MLLASAAARASEPAPATIDTAVEREREVARSVLHLLTPRFAEAACAIAHGEKTDFAALFGFS